MFYNLTLLIIKLFDFFFGNLHKYIKIAIFNQITSAARSALLESSPDHLLKYKYLTVANDAFVLFCCLLVKKGRLVFKVFENC